jgi:hypothetical protein
MTNRANDGGVPVGISLIRKASDSCCPRVVVNRIFW